MNVDLINQLWERTTVKDSCWLINTTASNGYPNVQYNGYSYKANRISLSIYLGLKLNDQSWLACHICPNKNCWNPLHLYQGTPTDNIHDKIKQLGHHNSHKVCCPKGHEYTKENTYLIKGSRFCKTCAKAKASDRYYRSKNARDSRSS